MELHLWKLIVNEFLSELVQLFSYQLQTIIQLYVLLNMGTSLDGLIALLV